MLATSTIIMKCKIRTTSNIPEKFTTSVQKFSDDTSMHGFTELYYAKTNFWKITWFLVMGVAFGMTAYQVWLAIAQYRSSNTGASFERAQKDHVIYPPVKFCIAHWLHWIDWYKVETMGFSKEELLVGMSYLTNIYSNHSFDVAEVQRNFTENFSKNNFTSIQSFYKAIARDVVLFPENLFTSVELLILDLSNVYLCYVANGSDVQKTINSIKSDFRETKQTNRLKISYFDFQDLYGNWITPEEYNSYMAEWIVQRTNQYNLNEIASVSTKDRNSNYVGYAYVKENYANIRPPHVILIDGYGRSGGITLSPDVDEYFVNVKASAHVWKNTKENRCEPSKLAFKSDSSCADYCSRRAAYCPVEKCTKLKNVLLLDDDNVNDPNRLCQNNFFFIHENDVQNGTTSSSSKTGSSCNRDETVLTEIYNDCISKNCTQGCEKWTFEFTVTTRSIFPNVHTVARKDSTDIYVQYPLSEDILIMTETDSQTWENFLGSVGGLLGIWTGASIISFFQLFYLCCCSEIGDPLCWQCFCSRKLITAVGDKAKNDENSKNTDNRKEESAVEENPKLTQGNNHQMNMVIV